MKRLNFRCHGCMFPVGFTTIDIGLSRKVRDAGDVADRDFKGHLEGDSDLGRKFSQIFEWKNERARSISQCNRNEGSTVFITISRQCTAPRPLVNRCETFLLPEACRAALGVDAVSSHANMAYWQPEENRKTWPWCGWCFSSST
jgi:hypothetical protein